MGLRDNPQYFMGKAWKKHGFSVKHIVKQSQANPLSMPIFLPYRNVEAVIGSDQVPSSCVSLASKSTWAAAKTKDALGSYRLLVHRDSTKLTIKLQKVYESMVKVHVDWG